LASHFITIVPPLTFFVKAFSLYVCVLGRSMSFSVRERLNANVQDNQNSALFKMLSLSQNSLFYASRQWMYETNDWKDA